MFFGLGPKQRGTREMYLARLVILPASRGFHSAISFTDTLRSRRGRRPKDNLLKPAERRKLAKATAYQLKVRKQLEALGFPKTWRQHDAS